MRFSTFSIVVTAASVALAVPTPFKRGINCAAVDDNGTALTGSSADATNSFATCIYKGAGDCTYFFADGSFSSGSSACPQGLPQDTVSAGTSNSDSSSSDSINTAASDSVVCPAVDKDGSALSASSSFKDELGNEFAQCTYPSAGVCAFFFADGSFSSGSSTCPKGLPQPSDSGSGGGSTTTTPATTTTSTPPPPPPTTTSSPPSPPPETTSSTSTETPPPETTSEAPITSTSTFFSTVQPETTSEAPITSTSTFFSTVQPTTEVSASTTTTPVVQAPPATTPATTDDTVTTIVIVSASPTPSGDGGVANSGANANNNNSNGAVSRGAGSVLAVLPAVFVIFTLLFQSQLDDIGADMELVCNLIHFFT
ncbi:hypothetical protein MVEN_00619800 [Mycena venus]|uniref:Uncharacterized protein n=1 Tax=Mycena venus TaxID=2733690 RepID=A0A8H6YRN7_9AGAR|nr:hypothetical protein MVEN_00619800 [Mycena venus]